MPEKNRVVAGGMPVMMGTRNVAPNMATTCCMPTPMVSGQASRSSGATTWPGLMDLPLPWSFHFIPSMLMGGAFQGVAAGAGIFRCKNTAQPAFLSLSADQNRQRQDLRTSPVGPVCCVPTSPAVTGRGLNRLKLQL